ncbi:MAG: pilus assembly FimT family protein [Luteolibacter sp.]
MRSYPHKSVSPRNRQDGFTLIEVLVVVAIIGIMLVVAVPMFSNSSNSARQASRGIIKAHLQQARAHAIASGNATAVVIPELSVANDELAASAVTLLEVEKGTSGSYEAISSDSTDPNANSEMLQRWTRLPGNIHLLSSAQAGSSDTTIMDETDSIDVKFNGDFSSKFVVFSPNGQIVSPAAGIRIVMAIGQAVKRGENLTLTQKNGDNAVVEIFEVNRLTGRTRFIDP